MEQRATEKVDRETLGKRWTIKTKLEDIKEDRALDRCIYSLKTPSGCAKRETTKYSCGRIGTRTQYMMMETPLPPFGEALHPPKITHS